MLNHFFSSSKANTLNSFKNEIFSKLAAANGQSAAATAAAE